MIERTSNDYCDYRGGLVSAPAYVAYRRVANGYLAECGFDTTRECRAAMLLHYGPDVFTTGRAKICAMGTDPAAMS